MNALYLSESDYGKPDGRPNDVYHGRRSLRAGQFRERWKNSGGCVPGGSAIVEWLTGKVVIHHSKEYRVMTNSPTFDEQLAIENYWKGVDPLVLLQMGIGRIAGG